MIWTKLCHKAARKWWCVREKFERRCLSKSRDHHKCSHRFRRRSVYPSGLDRNTKFLPTRSCEPSCTNLPMIIHGSNSFDCKVSCNSLYIGHPSLSSCFLLLNEVNMTTLSSAAFTFYLPQSPLPNYRERWGNCASTSILAKLSNSAISKPSQHSFKKALVDTLPTYTKFAFLAYPMSMTIPSETGGGRP
jgi:hypothetical protein